MDELHRRVRDLRLKAGLSQEALAARTDLSVRTILRIESGACKRPARTTLRLIAQALGVTVPELFQTTKGGEAA